MVPCAALFLSTEHIWMKLQFPMFGDYMNRIIGLLIVAICFVAGSSNAQRPARGSQPQSTSREDALDPTPVDPSVDPNVDMFINDYRNVKPHTVYGSLAFRDILTKLDAPDPVRPSRKGAVLTAITAISYATLAPGATASGRASQGSEQIFFATAGEGKITVNSKPYDVKDGVGFTLTPDFDFKLTSTGKEPLAFYVRTETLPENYKPS